jgi:mevalonate kinase
MASAASKAILFGEHAVVYGRPAVAVPVSDVRALAEVTTAMPNAGITVQAHDLGRVFRLDDPPDDAILPLQETVRNTLRHLRFPVEHMALNIAIRSRVPIARGMGSGAAVATALVRALGKHLARVLGPAAISALVFRTEAILHGTPSGIDNTVVAYERPLYYRNGRVVFVPTPEACHLVIADSGAPSRTRDTVAQVRRGWETDRDRYEMLFDAMARCADAGREALQQGNPITLGALLFENHTLLQQLGVSTAHLDALVDAARRAGALGAKLTGGGGGGCMVALAFEEEAPAVTCALRNAGAAAVYYTVVECDAIGAWQRAPGADGNA